MWVRDEILAAVSSLKVSAVQLSLAEASALEMRVERAFAVPGDAPLWERLGDHDGVQDPDGWRRLVELVLGPATLFVRDSQGICAFRFDDATSLVEVLADCSAFVFYVVDADESYLLAFNDHDFLIGCGAATAWVRELRLAAP